MLSSSPSSATSVHIEHLLHLSSSPPNATFKPKFIKSAQPRSTRLTSRTDKKKFYLQKPNSVSVSLLENGGEEVAESADGAFDFLPGGCELLLDSIIEQPVSGLNSFFDSIMIDLIEVDLVSLLKGLDISGNWERAVSLFEWVVLNLNSQSSKLDNQVVELMVRILGRESQHSIAAKLFDAIPIEEYFLDVRAYTTILHAYSRAENYGRAISLFEHMHEMGLSPTLVTYNVMLDVYGKMGRSWGKILTLLDDMRSKGLEFDEFTCSTVISACGREGMLEEAKKFLPMKEDKALRLFVQMKESGCVPNVCTYNAILGMLGKKSRSMEMMEIISDMKSNGCAPNRITWNTMLAMCGSKGMHKYVNRVFREMKNCGFDPDRDTFNTLISAYGRCGSGIDAAKMYDEMIKAGFTPSITTYNALLNALARRGDWKAAESILLDMRNKGFKPSETTYSLMLHSFQGLKKNGYKPDLVLLNAMLSIFARNKMNDRAHEILELIHENGMHPDLVTYNSLIDMQGLMQEAMRILSEMTTRGIRPCIVTFNTFVAGYAARGLFNEVDDVISYMIQHNCRPNELTYKTVVDGYCKAKKYREAMDFVSRIREMDNSFDELSLHRLTYGVRENMMS
ncbi:unnamed protein product [Thlaspi arvense]|uniref:Pentatricopeptide repeat-containing protein n=1 Tax=Thlaspi arvense TaxID=13288 RepID=A0AAU9TB78_THLAR|nr:unnamed protein product [Thlaspi arvense]